MVDSFPAAAHANKCRVLVVEDDALTHTTLARVLEQAGHAVEAVGTVAGALLKLPDVQCVVLDLNLPDGNGMDVLRRARELHLPVRIAVHTGIADPAVLRDVRALRPDALFLKPFDPFDLITWLDLQRGTPPGESPR
jgi:CheY-like chemotaxis protein